VASFERSAVVAAPPDAVWERVVSPEGINDEMRPWLTMRLPRSARGLTIETLPIGAVLGRAWVVLFGLLPIEYDRLAIVAVEPGRYFHEESTMLTMRWWEHRRTLSALNDESTRVTDHIEFLPRLGLMTPVMAKALYAFFGHRHRRLQRHFEAGNRED
jgi:ligand-binding SRPBCC domain-containing protein